VAQTSFASISQDVNPERMPFSQIVWTSCIVIVKKVPMGQMRKPEEAVYAKRPPSISVAKSEQMRAMPRASTKSEIALRKILHSRGLRYRIQLHELPGTPDIVFTKAKIAVFVDGCFWHNCGIHRVAPKHNREWWLAKLAANADRDRRKDEQLVAMGWMPIHIWEHEKAEDSADTVERAWRIRTGKA
jgi:DNA mismatch endonuclease (patch repair protein)